MIIRCMLCERTVEMEDFPIFFSPSLVFSLTAKKHGWQSTWLEGKSFICCPDCVPKAYNPNESLGRLKPEMYPLMVADDPELDGRDPYKLQPKEAK